MKKYISFISIFIFFSFLVLYGKVGKTDKGTPGQVPASVAVEIPENIAVSSRAPVITQARISPVEIEAPVATPQVKASLLVGGQEYSLVVAENETLEVAMKNLVKISNFSFDGKDFSGMGFFVDIINGQKNGGGKYWILYVNDSLAAEGISQLLIKPGDRIEWRYEQGK